MKTAAEYMRVMRARKRRHPERYECACGRVGAVFRSGEVVCHRCLKWERTYYRRHAWNRGR